MTLSTEMNTAVSSTATPASPAAARSFPFDRATWLAVRAAWKSAANTKTATAAQHAAYALLRGASLDKAFSPIRNPAKITSNGNNPHAGRDAAVRAATSGTLTAWAPWAELLKDVPHNRGGWAYEGAHSLLDAARAEAARQGF